MDGIVFEGEGEVVTVEFTESTLMWSQRLLPPHESIPYWRWLTFDGEWHYVIYRNWGIPNW